MEGCMSGQYMDFRRKKRAVETLRIIHECASEAGIRKALYVNFGLLLGIIRSGDFIPWDTDIDMCLKQELITPEQEIKYFQLLEERGVFKARKKWSTIKDENGFSESQIDSKNDEGKKVRLTWFSLRKASGYPKFCHWIMLDWNGITWHSKAGQWVKKSKFNRKHYNYQDTDEAILKGIPQNYVEKLMEINFYGIKIQIPALYGSCLDFLYPGWLTPRFRGASASKIVCVAKKWADKKTWRVVIN